MTRLRLPVRLPHVRPLLVACCLLVVMPAQAKRFCADNGAELYQAIGLAAVNGEDDEIRLSTGYIGLPYGIGIDPGQPIFEYRPIESDLDKALTISGGWEPEGVCNAQPGNPADTVVDTATFGSAFYFRAAPNFNIGADTTLRGAIAVRNLSIEGTVADKDGDPGNPAADAAAIQYVGITQGASLTIERVFVRDAQVIGTSNSVISVHVHGTGNFKVLNNALFDNNLYGDNGSTALWVVCEGGALCYVNNNSIHDNLATSNALRPGMMLGGIVNASNNVVADNTLVSGLPTSAQAGPTGPESGLDLRNNHFQSEAFSNPYNMTATTYGDAYWTRVGLHRVPNFGSPLRNSGRNNPLGGSSSLDIVGNPRVREGTIDRGAYETINLPPVLSAPSSVVVSAVLPAGDTAYATTIVDPDGSAQPLSYSLSFVSCAPNAASGLFAIDSMGRVRLAGSVPANVNSCFIVAKVADGSLTTEASTTVTFNRPPQLSDAQILLPGSTPVGSLVHTFAAQDDGVPSAALTYSVVAIMGPGNPFALLANGKLNLAQPLLQQGGNYTVQVKACDTMPLCDTGTLTIEVEGPGAGLFRDGFEN